MNNQIQPAHDLAAKLMAACRHEIVDGVAHYSIVDVIAYVRPDIRNLSKFWTDNRYELLAKESSVIRHSRMTESVVTQQVKTGDNGLPEQDEELVDSIKQLKMLSSDGKRYKTDAAPKETVLYIAAKIDNRFLKYLVKSRLWETNYRLSNIEQGYERAADEIHEIMVRNCTPADELGD